MKNNEAVVTAAVQQNGHALKHTAEELKNNVAIVMAAAQQNERAHKHTAAARKNHAAILVAEFQNGLLPPGDADTLLRMMWRSSWRQCNGMGVHSCTPTR